MVMVEMMRMTINMIVMDDDGDAADDVDDNDE